MKIWHLFWGFFVANALGYGGGPASIPLMQNEVVVHYHWMSNAKFANALALGNALPGPIAANIATYVGFQVDGWIGVLVALVATIVPSALVLLVLLRILQRYRQSPAIQGMTRLVQPVITVMMFLLTFSMARDSLSTIGVWQSLGIAAVALVAMAKFKIHPAFLILAAFLYGGLIIPYI